MFLKPSACFLHQPWEGGKSSSVGAVQAQGRRGPDRRQGRGGVSHPTSDLVKKTLRREAKHRLMLPGLRSETLAISVPPSVPPPQHTALISSVFFWGEPALPGVGSIPLHQGQRPLNISGTWVACFKPLVNRYLLRESFCLQISSWNAFVWFGLRGRAIFFLTF